LLKMWIVVPESKIEEFFRGYSAIEKAAFVIRKHPGHRLIFWPD